MDYTKGTLWNSATQSEAAMVSKNMYAGDNYVESDLVNSYAWDTAIVYIQAMENANYANTYDANGTLKNTGKTEDHPCKIFDMSGNSLEYTTEYSKLVIKNNAKPCIIRGGSCHSANFTCTRGCTGADGNDDYEYGISFRTLIYVK